MKLNFYRILAFLALIGLSVGFGFAYDGIATAIEKHRYPQEASVAPLIRENAQAYGLPEAILWATVRTQSNFQSNAVSSDGAIGLMQLTPETFRFICTEVLGEEATDSGMLYEPSTNLRAGAAYLSYLYERYGVWDMVYAAYTVGIDEVDVWLTNPDLLTPLGELSSVPNEEAAKYVKQMQRTVKLYNQLYYES